MPVQATVHAFCSAMHFAESIVLFKPAVAHTRMQLTSLNSQTCASTVIQQEENICYCMKPKNCCFVLMYKNQKGKLNTKSK